MSTATKSVPFAGLILRQHATQEYASFQEMIVQSYVAHASIRFIFIASTNGLHRSKRIARRKCVLFVDKCGLLTARLSASFIFLFSSKLFQDETDNNSTETIEENSDIHFVLPQPTFASHD